MNIILAEFHSSNEVLEKFVKRRCRSFKIPSKEESDGEVTAKYDVANVLPVKVVT